MFRRLLARGPALPAERRPPFEPDERVLAWASVRDEGVLVVTNRGLWLPDSSRLGWHEIHKVVWSGRELTITPAVVLAERTGYDVVADLPPLSYLLLDPGSVPQEVRSRVTRSVAYTAHHPLAGGVRVVARRVSGVDGLRWAVRFDSRADRDGPEAIEATDELVRDCRAAAG